MYTQMLVSASSCGLLIGRDGANIKHLKNDSSVTQIQISPKQSEGMLLASASERIMTITGPTLQSCVCCVHLVLMHMSLNPELFRYTNMTSKSVPAAPPMSACPIRANNANDSSPSYTATFNQPGQEDSPLLHVPCIETYCYDMASLARDPLHSSLSTSTNHLVSPPEFFQPPSQGYSSNFIEVHDFTSQMTIPGKSIHVYVCY